ncbi:uncharacterized protein LOC141641388 [Silene latifolia]|uniref:uncharacterized protein LOC141641388 n=1 Tax=Silene latifolia TaxID=37657 RepID=UPI003D776FA4
MGLDSKLYGNIRTNLLMEDPIATLNRAYGLILREERHVTVTKSKEEREETAMAARTYGGGRGQGAHAKTENEDREPPLPCSHCGKYYHTEENFYDKHGYETVKARERGRGRRGGNTNRGSHGRGRGRGRGQNGHQANAITGTSGTKTGESSKQNVPFTDSEIERIRILLNSSADGNEKLQGMTITVNIEWLIDSGASHHMTGKRDLLQNSWVENYSIVTSLARAHYFLTIVDDRSRGVWVYLMKDKSEAGVFLKIFCQMVKTQFDKCVKIIQSDNGTELLSWPMQSYYEENGILFQTSNAGTPQRNGRVERKHRHILEKARALRFQGELPLHFWGECILTAAYLINRTPTPLLEGKTPYEILYQKRPKLDNLKVFGCLCYVHNNEKPRDKFGERGKRRMFIGYPHSKKGWKVYDLKEKRVFVSRDVIFYEHVYLFLPSNTDSCSQQEATSNKNHNNGASNSPDTFINTEDTLVVRGSDNESEDTGAVEMDSEVQPYQTGE